MDVKVLRGLQWGEILRRAQDDGKHAQDIDSRRLSNSSGLDTKVDRPLIALFYENYHTIIFTCRDRLIFSGLCNTRAYANSRVRRSE